MNYQIHLGQLQKGAELDLEGTVLVIFCQGTATVVHEPNRIVTVPFKDFDGIEDTLYALVEDAELWDEIVLGHPVQVEVRAPFPNGGLYAVRA